MQPTQPATDPVGVLALILGIASLPLVFCFVLGLPAGLAAIGLGALGLHRARQGRAGSRWPALVGLLCGVIATAAMAVVIALPN